jgi:hypothetical protein
MASQLIPTLTDGTQAYTVTVRLDGVSFRFDFAWNPRGSFWSFILYDAAANPLVRRRVVVGFPLLARFKDVRMPYGELVAIDTTQQGTDPGIDELGARVQLVYLAAADLFA